MDGRLSCLIDARKVPIFPQALAYADEFLLTAAAQRNRNYVSEYVEFSGVSFAMEEVLFDPQTSGGLLLAVPPGEAGSLVGDLQNVGLPAAVVGEITKKQDKEIYVYDK
jgi:selenide,water dikinase